MLVNAATGNLLLLQKQDEFLVGLGPDAGIARLGRPKIRPALVAEIERLASSTNLSVRQIHQNLSAQASRGFIGEITKRARAAEGFSLASQAV